MAWHWATIVANDTMRRQISASPHTSSWHRCSSTSELLEVHPGHALGDPPTGLTTHCLARPLSRGSPLKFPPSIPRGHNGPAMFRFFRPRTFQAFFRACVCVSIIFTAACGALRTPSGTCAHHSLGAPSRSTGEPTSIELLADMRRAPATPDCRKASPHPTPKLSTGPGRPPLPRSARPNASRATAGEERRRTTLSAVRAYPNFRSRTRQPVFCCISRYGPLDLSGRVAATLEQVQPQS